MTKKINVLYIAGLGHSGSTILDLLIGTSDKCIPLGELEFLPDFVVKRNLPKNIKHVSVNCLCKKPVKQCNFWKPVLKNVDINELYPYQSSLWDKIRLGLSIYLPFLRKKTENYTDELLIYEIMKQAKKTNSKVRYILDSSKDFRRLVYLHSLNNVNLYVIHLIRDGRGVINSNEKLGRPGLSALIQWLIVNILISRFLKKDVKKENYITLSYDLFAQYPREYVKILNSKFKLDISLRDYVERVNSKEYHHIDGNPASRRKFTNIRYDQSWKSRMPKWKQMILSILVFFPNKRWVYRKND